MSKVVELYGISTTAEAINWSSVIQEQFCPYLQRKCLKVRKSAPDVTIGTCTVQYGRPPQPIMICPYRFLEHHQIFTDCIHLLTLHEPGNELHLLPEITIPGGSVDYFLVSSKKRQVKDFVGIEVQTLDTTGSVWPERQRFLHDQGLSDQAVERQRSYGMNWKMTAKTTLVQLHHKVQTFENIHKHLVLVVQEQFLNYMRQEFRFEHLVQARVGDSAHIHAYELEQRNDLTFGLDFKARFSTDANGIAHALGLQASPIVELEEIIKLLEDKMTEDTLIIPFGRA